MKKGLNLIIECPNCGKSLSLVRYMHIYSYGAKTYSDGNISAPDFIKNVEQGACPVCSNNFWLNDVKIIGEKLNSEPNFNEPSVKTMDLTDLRKFLEENLPDLSTGKELYIRLEIWHLYNQLILRELEIKDDYYLKNARAIIKLFKTENSVERITLAELYRNTGDFNSCLELLNYKFEDDFIHSVNQIKKKALLQDPFTFEIIN